MAILDDPRLLPVLDLHHAQQKRILLSGGPGNKDGRASEIFTPELGHVVDSCQAGASARQVSHTQSTELCIYFRVLQVHV